MGQESSEEVSLLNHPSSRNVDDEVFVLNYLGPKHLPYTSLIPISAVYSVIFISGLIGNFSTCMVIAKAHYMRTSTNYYLFNLAIADMLILICARRGNPFPVGGARRGFAYPGEEVVWISKAPNSVPKVGTIAWVGYSQATLHAGLIFPTPIGNMNGFADDRQLFVCDPNHGALVDLEELFPMEIWNTINADDENADTENADTETGNNETDGPVRSGNPVCSICLSDLFEKPCANTLCGHSYHEECLTKWMEVRPMCPYCNKAIPRGFPMYFRELE